MTQQEADRYQRIEDALIRWRENQADEWRTEYYFDCGPFRIVRLFAVPQGTARYWRCQRVQIEPCPVLIEEITRQAASGV